jgi:nucleoid-associated protein YgaU
VALPKSIGIKLFDDSFVPVLTENEIKNKRLILTTVKDNQKKVIIELYEGTSDKCINNEYLGKLVISLDRTTVKGEPGIEAHLRLSEDGKLFAKAWDTESREETEITIEHTQSQRIHKEILSDEEINKMSDTASYENISDFSDEELLINDEKEDKEKKDIFPIIRIAIAVLIILVIVSLLGLGGFFIYKSANNYLTQQNKKIEEMKKVEEQNKKLEEQKKIDEEKRLADEKKKKDEEDARLAKLKKEEENKSIIGKKDLKGKKHYIRWGENLWNISRKYYMDPWYYPSLAEINNLKNPRKIFAGTYLIIPNKTDLSRWDFKK